MLTTILLDLDETLCDTTGANSKALIALADQFCTIFSPQSQQQGEVFAKAYLKGIYRDLDARYREILLSIGDEEAFRIALIGLILKDMALVDYPDGTEAILQTTFDSARTQYFDFFPTIENWLQTLRKNFTLGVITNGPIFSQQVKVDRIKLKDKVDFVIIGGEEPEQKPAKSIFDKALKLANCDASQAIHIGDSFSADIEGANAAGIQSVWISYGQKQPRNTSTKPTYTLDSPMDLSEFFKYR